MCRPCEVVLPLRFDSPGRRFSVSICQSFGYHPDYVSLSAAEHYSVSGVVVRTVPADLPAVTARLSALPGLEVHYQEETTGRLVIALETTDVDEEQRGIDRIRTEAGVISAELVYHFVEPPAGNDGAGVDHSRQES